MTRQFRVLPLSAALAALMYAVPASAAQPAVASAPAQQAVVQEPAAPASAAASAVQAASAAAAPAAPIAAVPALKKPATIEQLKKELRAVDSARGTTIDVPADTVFDFNQAGVRIEAAPTLEKLADLLRKMNKPVLLTGHTDNKGNAGYDKTLSQYRATALKTALIQRGIRGASIKTAGAGQQRPKAANTNPDGSDNPAGREANRRIEVLISKR